jgi:DegV family protein with EDD domain
MPVTAQFALVTDSTSDLPDDLVRQHQIYIAPLHIMWGRDHFIDGVDITPAQFYDRLAKEDQLPTSSQPSPQEFAEIFERAVKETGAPGILTLTISADLSGTYSSAVAAASMVDFPVEVVDLRTASIATGLSVLKLAQVRDAGMPLQEALALAQSFASRTQLIFSVDTLEYLHKGGRIGGARRLLGTALNIKPVLQVIDGRVEPRESVRTRKRVLSRMVEIFEAEVDSSKPLNLGILHANAPQDAEALRTALLEHCSPELLVTTQISAVISVHTGPGAVGFAILQ